MYFIENILMYINKIILEVSFFVGLKFQAIQSTSSHIETQKRLSTIFCKDRLKRRKIKKREEAGEFDRSRGEREKKEIFCKLFRIPFYILTINLQIVSDLIERGIFLPWNFDETRIKISFLKRLVK